MTTIKFKGVTKTFNNGFQAIQRTDLTIHPGEFTVILGSSGAGKSTLLRMVNGLEKPSEGEVFIEKRKLTPQNQRHIRAKVGMIFQQFNLVNRLNVMTNILIGRSYYRRWWESLFYLFSKQDYELAHWALERVNLTDKVWQRADNLSGGQQQRVAIARVLVQKPQIIIADEPVASLDPATSLEIMELIFNICKEDGVTVLASLHQVNLAMQFADRIIGIKQGKVVFDDKPVNLLNNSLLETIYHQENHENLALG